MVPAMVATITLHNMDENNNGVLCFFSSCNETYIGTGLCTSQRE